MTERIVVCGGLQAERGDPDNLIELDVQAGSGLTKKINLKIGDICDRMVANMPEVLIDLLEISSYVYCADQFTKRGTNLMRDMGAEWRRKFDFRIPVRRPDIWMTSPVVDALTDTLSFLSEDEYRFEFVKYENPPSMEPYLDFGDSSVQGFQPDEIILFSGGIDSLAGAVDELLGNGKRVALVSHCSSRMIQSKQSALVAALRDRTESGQLFHVPVTVNKNHEDGKEFTQRSRSFLFATLGVVVARLFKRNTVHFFENGIVSLNFPTAEHALGARATRTTHPQVIEGFSRLFSTILDETITFNNLFLWKTKSDIVQILADRGCADLINTPTH